MQDTLSKTFAALADPTRRAMLEHLSRGTASVGDLAKPFRRKMSLPAITKHLKVLEKAGFITKSVDAQFRRCNINQEAFQEVAEWMEQYRMYWEESLDRLDVYLKSIAPPTKEPTAELPAAEGSDTLANKGKRKQTKRK
ncbi:MAG: transcriptional regulator [Spirochaetaceae bacterium]|nr:transcriptional regulator [Spirochaetaceae bacterium]|tara:strand:+ start:271754 stop:272170 length:417 start_codon:yes stop_codon:yes gene_type:complete